MKKFLFTILLFLVALPISAKMLYEYGSFEERAFMAEEAGIVESANDYRGGYDENIRLLDYLENNGAETLGGSNPFQPSGVSVALRQSLSAGSSRTGTTLNIDPIITADGHRVTFSDFNSSVAFGKIDQGTDNEEIIKFTGITDNTTYYTLTGVTWGCNFYNNTCDVDANKKKHLPGSTFIITNDWHFIDANYASLGTSQNFTGLKTFNTVLPTSSLTATTSNQFTTKTYVDNVANQGAATSTETVAGISELATRTEVASSTDLGVNRPLVLQAKNATSTPYSDGIGAGYVCVTEDDGNISSDCLPTNDNITWSGQNTFSATTTFNSLMIGGNIVGAYTASTTITGAATPQPVYLATTTNALLLSDANATSTFAIEFLGFAISSGNNGDTVYVQTAGIVNGFSGLTPGAEYYVSDTAGVVSTTMGTYPLMIGRAVSDTQIIIERKKRVGSPILTAVNSNNYAYSDSFVNINGGISTLASYARCIINGLVKAESIAQSGTGNTRPAVSCYVKKGDIYNGSVDVTSGASVYFTPVN